jgi:hypothetical protein
MKELASNIMNRLNSIQNLINKIILKEKYNMDTYNLN